MRVSSIGALCLALCIPSVAAAEDVSVDLQGAQVPVGPAGTAVISVVRTQVGAERYAVIRARAPEQSTRCGVAPERVAVWGLLDGRWTEMAHEVLDRCLPAPAARGARAPRVVAQVRARVVDVIEAGLHRAEFRVRLIDPRLPPDPSTAVRYRRVGDRFAAQRVTDALAPTPGAAPQRGLAAMADGRADGRLSEWSSTPPLAAGERGSVWLAQQGERLLVAGDLLAADAPTVTVHLAEPGVGTARMRGPDGNRGRVVRLSCGDAARPEVRCARVGDRWHLEGSIDLTAQLYSRRHVAAVAVLAVAESGGHRILSSDPGMRLEPVRLAAPIDLLRGASREVADRCAGGFVGRASAPGAGGDDALRGALVTCGPACRGGQCELTMGTGQVAGRLEFANRGTCFRGTGPGAEEVDGCHAGASTRLVGAIQVQGFDAVLGVERSWSADGAQWRQGEIWTLVTASSGWRRLPVGAAEQSAPALFSRVQMTDGHPALCRDAGGCEVLQGLTLLRREAPSESVTGEVVATLREAGLLARREAP